MCKHQGSCTLHVHLIPFALQRGVYVGLVFKCVCVCVVVVVIGYSTHLMACIKALVMLDLLHYKQYK